MNANGELLFKDGDKRSIARAITMVENHLEGYDALLRSITFDEQVPVIGITGPPGAGKSTLINALIKVLLQRKNAKGELNKIAVLAVDPTSPFTHGSLLGDRLRMFEHFNHERVFIRSLATRGALGGLSARTLEVLEVMKAAGFDHIIIETVGVGQSEVEIVSMANTTIVVLVPEAGDEIQTLKSGIMEIGDLFVVNKADRAGADIFVANIHKTLHERPLKDGWQIPVLKTSAVNSEGIEELADAIVKHQEAHPPKKNIRLLAEQSYRLIQSARMQNVRIDDLVSEIDNAMQKGGFNLYEFSKRYY
ncbi:MAG: methylmalonyl Co-A mutase-associated GTPase MeaB [Bacteroidota bacterium]|jgi:LAO/AO transport system kinase